MKIVVLKNQNKKEKKNQKGSKEGREGRRKRRRERGRKNRRKEGKEKLNVAFIPNQKIKICKESVSYNSHLSFEYFFILKC